jgi:DNA-binding NtrC family response regulator
VNHHEQVTEKPHALVVDPPSSARIELGGALMAIGCRHSFATVVEAPVAVERHRPEVVIVSARDRDASCELACLQRLRAASCHPRLLFLAAVSSEDLAIAAFHSGAQHYLKAPWTMAMLQAAVIDMLPSMVPPDPGVSLEGGERLVGRSCAVRELRAYLARIAPTASNVLVLGETGTGKELVAELIHRNSRRASKPFVCLNTAAIPEALLENELFGHERGAFTGASSAQVGKLAAAHGGTVFFDEIGDVSPAIQAKLLRVIESKSLYPLGGTHMSELDIRVIAATNSDLALAVQSGAFRKDLFYRLNVLRVDLPPLRERPEDVPLLLDHYLRRFNRDLGRSVTGLSARAAETLRAYPWPGNVRELRNVVEALLVNLAPETTGEVDVPPQVMRQLAAAMSAPVSERERLLEALARTNWNKSKAAQQLRCSRMTLYRRMQRLQLGIGRQPEES